MVRDYLSFVGELPRSFASIGAMLPSSTALGKEMVRGIPRQHPPLRILEVGSGTGPFTRQILRRMGPEDTFVICERNPRFVDFLKRRLAKDDYYHQHRDRVSFFEGPVEEILGANGEPPRFDVIISSLPFFNFPPHVVEQLLNQFQTMLTEDGSMTFCWYLGIGKFGTLFSTRARKERVAAVEEVLKKWCDLVSTRGRVDRKIALRNVPPAVSVQFDFRQ